MYAIRCAIKSMIVKGVFENVIRFARRDALTLCWVREHSLIPVTRSLLRILYIIKVGCFSERHVSHVVTPEWNMTRTCGVYLVLQAIILY